MTIEAEARTVISVPAFWGLLGALIAVLAGVMAVIVCGIWGYPVILALLVPPLMICTMAALYRTSWGLYVLAFAIGPLGIIQAEVVSVTLNLPEVLILSLFIKEAFIFLVRRERVNPLLPWRSLSLFVVMCLLAVVVGLSNGNGNTRVLQDFRQFTEYVILYILVLHRIADPGQARTMMAAYLLGCTLLALHGVVQHFTDLGIPVNQALSDSVNFRGTRGGSFYGATPLGGIMVLATGVGISLTLGKSNRVMRFLFALSTIVCLVGAVYTYTRASWIAITITLIFIALFTKKTPVMVALTLIVALIFSALLGPMMMERIEKLSFSRAERSLHERVNYYTAAWRIFQDHPAVGLGWGCQYKVASILANEQSGQADPAAAREKHKSTPPNEATVHSAYLQLLVKGGLALLVSFLLFVLMWAKTMWSGWRLSGEHDRKVLVALIGGLIGYMAHSSVENFFQWPVMAQSFWMLLGLSTALCFHLTTVAESPTA